MVCERFYGPDEQFLGWRCISCGEIIDQVILLNRQTKADSENRGRRRGSC
jgi:hypothetical protein